MSMMPNGSPSGSPGLVALDDLIDDNDDEAEKVRNRKMMRESMAAAEAASPFTKTPRKKSQKRMTVVPLAQKLTDEQVTDMYSNCIKMSTENKITQKNAWNLGLLDQLDSLGAMSKNSVSGETNFQVASGAPPHPTTTTTTHCTQPGEGCLRWARHSSD